MHRAITVSSAPRGILEPGVASGSADFFPKVPKKREMKFESVT